MSVTKDDLKRMISELVRLEIEYQKDQMIKEIKAELFDIIMSKPQPKKSVEEVVESPKEDLSGHVNTSIRRLSDMMNESWDGVNFNTTNVDVPRTNSTNDKMRLPSTYEGPVKDNELFKEAVEAVNKDYSDVMKRLGLSK